jgi:hypothetical protein
LLNTGDLQKVQGAEADGQIDPDSSYSLAYDAARFACTALLAQQGLRPTSKGGHYAVEQAVRAQFQAHFRTFGVLRRRRNEVEYPTASNIGVSGDETSEAHAAAEVILEAAGKVLPHLSFF